MPVKTLLATHSADLTISPGRKATCAVYRVAGRFESNVSMTEPRSEELRFSRRFRADDLNQLVAISSASIEKLLTSSPDWRNDVLQVVREAHYLAQDAVYDEEDAPLGTLKAGPGIFTFDETIATSEKRFSLFGRVPVDAKITVDGTALALADILLHDTTRTEDPHVVALAAAAIVAGRRLNPGPDFDQSDVLVALDHVTRRLTT